MHYATCAFKPYSTEAPINFEGRKAEFRAIVVVAHSAKVYKTKFLIVYNIFKMFRTAIDAWIFQTGDFYADDDDDDDRHTNRLLYPLRMRAG